MSKIKLKVVDQNISLIDSPKIYSGDINTDQVVFEFDEHWTGYTKTAVFYRDIEKPYAQILTDYECNIPREVMTTEGRFYFGVFGVKGDELYTSEIVSYCIGAGIITTGTAPGPDQDIWQQIINQYAEIKELVEAIRQEQKTFIDTQTKNNQTFQDNINEQYSRYKGILDGMRTDLDAGIENLGEHEWDGNSIRFKDGKGNWGSYHDISGEFGTKEEIYRGYNVQDGISYGGSASNNGIDVAEIDGAYSQETTNGFQLFDASKLPTKSQGGATVTNNGDGSFTISGSGNLTETFSLVYQYSHEETLKLLKVGDINLVNGNSTKPFALVQLVKSGGTSTWFVLNKDISKATITQEMLNDERCVLQIYIYGDSGTTIQKGIIKPMLYQDGDGTWEPYTGGVASPNPEYPQKPKFVGDYNEDTQKYDIDFMTSGKNLFNINGNINVDGYSKEQKTTNTVENGVLTCNVNSARNHGVGQRLYGLKGKTISVSAKLKSLGEATIGNIYIYESSGAYKAVGNTTALDKVFAINNYTCATDDIVVAFAGTGGTGVQFYDIMVNYGAKFVDYEPFTGFETTTVELNQPLRALPNGVKDTIENGVVTRRVGVVTFDGSSDEAWKEYIGSTKTVHTYMINLDKPRGINDAICDKLVYIQDCWEKNTEFSYSTFAVGRGFYLNTNGEISTVDLFKTWLQSNPITVWYELATPTTEQITLPTLPSWYPYTNAWVETELQPSFVEWHIKTAFSDNASDLIRIENQLDGFINPLTVGDNEHYTVIKTMGSLRQWTPNRGLQLLALADDVPQVAVVTNSFHAVYIEEAEGNINRLFESPYPHGFTAENCTVISISEYIAELDRRTMSTTTSVTLSPKGAIIINYNGVISADMDIRLDVLLMKLPIMDV